MKELVKYNTLLRRSGLPHLRSCHCKRDDFFVINLRFNMWNKFHDKDMINQFHDRLIILGIYSFLLLFHLAKRNEYIYVANLFIFVADTSPFMFLKKRLIKKINKTKKSGMKCQILNLELPAFYGFIGSWSTSK